MTDSKICPRCGSPLPDNAPAGLCPPCLIQAGMASDPVAGAGAAFDPTTAPSSFIPPKPEVLGRYFPQLEVLELIGHGGMGAVYKARQPGLDRFVALKILPPEVAADPLFAERFTREARALARLSHPHIVAVHDFGRTASAVAGGHSESRPPEVRAKSPDRPTAHQGLFYFVMEYIDGVNLRQAMQSGQLQPSQSLAIVPQICDALQFAHDEGVVHRDIKPENILLDKLGRVKIADFGLSKLIARGAKDSVAAPPDLSLTGSRQVMGTIRYMAPEQIEGTKAVDHRADIYSLGVVFYEMLTGELPLGRFAPPSSKVQIDVRLDEVVLRSLEKEPQRRYQQAGEVKTDVETIQQTIKAALPGGIGRTKPSATPSGLPTNADAILQSPSDAILLVAGAALLTALGAGIWLALFGKTGLPANSRSTLVGMSWTLAIYSLFMASAGLMLRGLRFRMLALSCVVLVGLFLPAVLALNVVMEFDHIPQWPLVIPIWLGMPVAAWAAKVLFRDDVRAAFAARRGLLANDGRLSASDEVAEGSAWGGEAPSHLEDAAPFSSRFPSAPRAGIAVCSMIGLATIFLPWLYLERHHRAGQLGDVPGMVLGMELWLALDSAAVFLATAMFLPLTSRSKRGSKKIFALFAILAGIVAVVLSVSLTRSPALATGEIADFDTLLIGSQHATYAREYSLKHVSPHFGPYMAVIAGLGLALSGALELRSLAGGHSAAVPSGKRKDA